MIRLTRLNGSSIALNSDLIKFVENAPDTVLTLINGEKMIVRESTDDVVHKIVDFRREVLAGLPSVGADLNLASSQSGSRSPELTRLYEGGRRG